MSNINTTKTLFGLLLLAALVLLKTVVGQEQNKSNKLSSTEELINYLKEKHPNKNLKGFTFRQNTIKYSNVGKSKDSSFWHEAIKYPGKFRIDIGPSNEGNINLNRSDSIYVFRKHKLVHNGVNIAQSLILKGGFFHYSTATTLEKLKKTGIDVSLFSMQNYNGRLVYVVGATDYKLQKAQIWIDAENLYLLRRISKRSNGDLHDVQYSDYIKKDGYWIETKISIYFNEKIIQEEFYDNIVTNPNLDNGVFDPKKVLTTKWY